MNWRRKGDRWLRGALVPLLGFACCVAGAQTPSPGEDWKARREHISALRAQMRQIRRDALAEFNAASNRCLQEIINAKCLEDARNKRAAADAEALRIEKEVQALERRVKDETRAEKEANQAEKERRFATSTNKQEVKTRLQQEKAQLRRERGTPIEPRGPKEPLATDLIDNP